MQKNNSFLWFLIFAVYCAANALALFGMASLALVVVMFGLCCVCSGKNATLTACISAVFATAGLIVNRGAFGLFVFMMITALCLAVAYSRSFGYAKSAFILTVVISGSLTALILLAVCQATGEVSPEAVMRWLTDGFTSVGKLYADTLTEVYGTSFEEMAGVSLEQLVSVVKTASVNVMTGALILISSVTALAGTALSYKVRYPKVSLLDTYTLSPVGSIVIMTALIVFSTAGGKPMVIAGNIYMALLPCFAVAGIKALRSIFVKKRPVSLFTVITVAIIAFSAGLSAALAYLGAIDVVRGFGVYEK